MADPFNLARFEQAQAVNYDHALRELRDGRKVSHWMWYVFPQLAGLGHSDMARRYGISGRAEAEAYLAHPVLGPRLKDCAQALLSHPERSAREILGAPDDLKLRSSATLFAAVEGPGVFSALLERFFDGAPDAASLALLGNPVQDAYAAWSASYDDSRNLTRDLDAVITRHLLGGRRFRAAAEAGCGTGKNTPFYCSVAERVTAFDLTDEMLRRAAQRPDCTNATFHRGDLVQAWPVASASCDLVAFNLVLEHVEHLDAAFRQAAAASARGGTLYVSELHPFKQYSGSQARFERGGAEVRVPAYLHHLSDYLSAAERCGFALDALHEWWHDEDPRPGIPRLLTLQFTRL